MLNAHTCSKTAFIARFTKIVQILLVKAQKPIREAMKGFLGYISRANQSRLNDRTHKCVQGKQLKGFKGNRQLKALYLDKLREVLIVVDLPENQSIDNETKEYQMSALATNKKTLPSLAGNKILKSEKNSVT